MDGFLFTNSTQRFLALSLMDMSVGQDLEKITVKSLVEYAGVTRATFYNHFSNMRSLILFAGLFAYYTTDRSRPYDERIRTVCLFNMKHREFYMQLAQYGKWQDLWARGSAYRIEEEERQLLAAGMSPAELSRIHLKNVVKQSCNVALFLFWWGEGMQTPVDTMVDMFVALRRAIKEIIV